jgi:ankyrin repeat protein
MVSYTNIIKICHQFNESILAAQEEQDCLTALFLTDPLDDRQRLTIEKGSRVDGTCKWIKTNGLYESWLHSPSQLLWIFGGPGKGKTMLSIFLAEELERSAKKSQDTVFVQYFCDNKDEKRNTAVAIIRGLISQLLSQRPKLFRHILPSFRTQKESLFANSSFETLWRIFETMVHDPILGTTNCVLDGLDECDKASLEVLVRKLEALFSTKFKKTSTCHLNLIIVSRKLPDFVLGTLLSAPCIQLDADAADEVNHDICRFIPVKVSELSLHWHYPEQLRGHVKKVLLSRAAGTFLWVGIVANELRKYTSSEVEKALELFPPGLEGLYDRMLRQIGDQRREIAAKILRWVILAVRPLTLTELSTAIETPARHSLGLGYVETIRDRVSYCGYFLTIKNNEVGLIHQSAKEYLLHESPHPDSQLEYFRIKAQQANLQIARKCLKYLQNGVFAAGEVSQEATLGQLKDMSSMSAFPLFSYAATYWPEHTRSLPSSVDVFDLSLPFYKEKSPVREFWLKTFWATREHEDLPKSFSLLHLASYFGIVPLAENLLFKKSLINRLRFHSLGNKGDSLVNKTDGNGQTALYWAAKGGHPAVMQLLLENGADIEAKNSKGWTPLHSAAERGNEAVVYLLLEKRADAKAKDKSGWMALHSAARSGHKAIVRLLLSTNDDDVNAEDKEGNTALHEAAGNGHNAVIEVLLENRANIETKNSTKWTPLHSAAERASEASVRLLLVNGADVKANTSNGWTALHLSARRGHVAVARLLLEAGAFIEQKDDSGATALHHAAGSGYIAVVRVLLEKQVDIEA